MQCSAKSCLFFLMIGYAVVWASPGYASCAKVNVAGNGDCAGLKVSLDLSACPFGDRAAKPVVECGSDKAVIHVVADKATYSATLTLGAEAWGKRAWEMVGSITETQTAASPAEPLPPPASPQKAEKAKRAEKPARSEVSHTPKAAKVPAASIVVPPAAPAPVALTPAAPPPLPPPPAWLKGLTISVLADVYYDYNMNRPIPAATASSAPLPAYRGLEGNLTSYRNFDVRDNQFALSLGELSIKRTGDEMALRLDLDFGDTADMMHKDSSGRTDEVGKHIGQAIITYSPKAVAGLSLNVGKMATHLGWETTKAKDNWQYSRSLLFALALPYWHTGANLSYAPSETVTLNAYVYNGWNSMVDNNQGKTVGAQLAVTPIPGLTVIYNGIGGSELPNDEKHKRIVHEGILTYNYHDKLGLAVDYVTGQAEAEGDLAADGTKGTGSWRAAEVALRWSVAPTLYLSPRFESYTDANGTTSGTVQVLKEGTLTCGVMLGEGLETRFEVRQDMSDHEVFLKQSDAAKAQATASWSLLANF